MIFANLFFIIVLLCAIIAVLAILPYIGDLIIRWADRYDKYFEETQRKLRNKRKEDNG